MSPDPQKDLNRRLRLLSLAAFASMASMRWCDALLPVLATEFTASTSQTSAVVYAFAITYGLMQLVYGPVGDRFGKYTVVSFATLACTVGVLASALSPTLGWLTVARVLTGATAAGVIPLAMAWVGDQVPWEQRQPVLARFMGATIAGMIAGQWLSGVFADLVGWRVGFVGLAVLFSVAGLAMRSGTRGADVGDGVQAAGGPVQGSPAAQKPRLSSVQRAREVLASGLVRRVLLITAIEGGFATSAMAFAPSHLHDRFGIAVSTAGAILALYGLGGLLYSRNAGALLARLRPLTMARAGGVLSGLSWVLFALAPGPAWTLPMCLLAGLGFYMIHNTLQTQATQMAPTQRGTAVALFACSLFIGQSIGMGLASWLVDRFSTTPMLVGYGLGLALVGVAVAHVVRVDAGPPAVR
jgi:MFS transporter, YNFM family, putative membrane transport protein